VVLFLSSQFKEAQSAAKAQGKALVYIETDTESSCPKTQSGTSEAYSALSRDYILVVQDDALPECINVVAMYAAINETVKIGNSSPRITVVEPTKLKFITGAGYNVISTNKNWDKEMKAKIDEAMKPLTSSKTATAITSKTELLYDWTNTEGKTIRAALIEKKENSVILKLESGKTVEYPLEKLSTETKASLIR
jgi:hypothetical protein